MVSRMRCAVNTGRSCCVCVYGVGLFKTKGRFKMKLKTPQQAKAIKERARKMAESRTWRLRQRRLDADERKFLNEFKEVWE